MVLNFDDLQLRLTYLNFISKIHYIRVSYKYIALNIITMPLEYLFSLFKELKNSDYKAENRINVMEVIDYLYKNSSF